MADNDLQRDVEAVSRAPVATVIVLTLAMTMSYCGRYMLNVVIEPIKQDFALSDVQVAIVLGFAFAMFFVVGGLPLGILVDRTRRMPIVTASILLWSLATCSCGLVRSFGGLLACRIAVAVGEAALTPAAFSIFADSLPRRRLGLGIGVFSLGVYLGAGLAFLGGAALLMRVGLRGADLPVLGHLHDWQVAFLIVGLTGVPLAVAVAGLREPPRTGAPEDLAIASFGDVLAFARRRRRVLVPLFVRAGFAALTSQAYAAWMPSWTPPRTSPVPA